MLNQLPELQLPQADWGKWHSYMQWADFYHEPPRLRSGNPWKCTKNICPFQGMASIFQCNKQNLSMAPKPLHLAELLTWEINPVKTLKNQKHSATCRTGLQTSQRCGALLAVCNASEQTVAFMSGHNSFTGMLSKATLLPHKWQRWDLNHSCQNDSSTCSQR